MRQPSSLSKRHRFPKGLNFIAFPPSATVNAANVVEQHVEGGSIGTAKVRATSVAWQREARSDDLQAL